MQSAWPASTVRPRPRGRGVDRVDGGCRAGRDRRPSSASMTHAVATPAVFPRRLAGRSPRGVLRAGVGRSSGSGLGTVRSLRPGPRLRTPFPPTGRRFPGNMPQCHDGFRFHYRCGAAPEWDRTLIGCTSAPASLFKPTARPAPTDTTYRVLLLRQHQMLRFPPRPRILGICPKPASGETMRGLAAHRLTCRPTPYGSPE